MSDYAEKRHTTGRRSETSKWQLKELSRMRKASSHLTPRRKPTAKKFKKTLAMRTRSIEHHYQ